ncbi:MAG TPA: LuxR C-terminal-related transcriptional regulator [Candidatus Udaeobacter sp.]
MRGNNWLITKREPVIDPALEKPLLKLHRATDVESFWKAIHRLLSASIANHSVGLLLQQNPGVLLIAKWTRSMPDDFFTAGAFMRCARQRPRRKMMRLNDLFHNRNSFVRSGFYRHNMAPQKCAHGVMFFFWKRQRLICTIAILRTAKQGRFSPAELKLLRHLYPQLLTALRRIELLERERSVRADLEEFLRRLPLPTIILRWNLKPIYQNKAAREFCALWEKGPEEARRTKANSSIPCEILDRCRVFKENWKNAQPQMRAIRRSDFKEEQLHHPRLPHLRATIQLKQINSVGAAGPHFLIACEDRCRNGERSGRLGLFRLPGIARLTRREREVAQLACEGRSNKEIAQSACLSLPTVKKHLHSVFRKLAVPSRSRLLALTL